MDSRSLSRWILATGLIAGIGVAWWVRRRPPQYATAYIGDRSVTLWSTTAQVRQTVGALGYGEKVSVIRETGDQAEVRSVNGAQGWLDAHLLMTPDMWHKMAELVASARSMPVQAVGHTRSFSNIHIEPNRDAARIFQFSSNVPLVVLDRREVPLRPSDAGTEAPNQDAASSATRGSEKSEAWLLVLRAAPLATAAPIATSTTVSLPAAGEPRPPAPQSDIPIAGWILARFVELDPPAPIPDYASAADLRVIAWVKLNSVPDSGAGSDGARPQYMVAGARGADAFACAFNTFRVFTWDDKRQRYETAYVASDLCGHLPILVQPTPAGPEFHFRDPDGEHGQRLYEMRQTVVRPVRQQEPGVDEKRPVSRHKRL